MPDFTNETSPKRYEIALQSLRDFVARRQDQIRDTLAADRERFVAIFATLDTADIRRLVREVSTDEELSLSLAFQFVCRFLACSKNTQAVVPLIEMLQSPVPALPKYKCKSLLEHLAYVVGKHTVARDFFRETDEIHRAARRQTTLRLLGHLEDRRAAAAIRPFLRDAEVRKAAQEALWSLSKA